MSGLTLNFQNTIPEPVSASAAKRKFQKMKLTSKINEKSIIHLANTMVF